MRTAGVDADPGALAFLLADHLGSTVGTVDAVTGAVTKQQYWPYGGARSGGVTQTDKQYTGQQQEPGDAALGLYNYKARFYSTVLGRFVSADAITRDGLNRYAYVRNNPLRFTDPSGKCVGDLYCSPSVALNTLACSVSVAACRAVLYATGHDAALAEAVHRLALAMVKMPEFTRNLLRPEINPFNPANWRTLDDSYVLPGARTALLKQLPGVSDTSLENARTLFSMLTAFCQRADCLKLGLSTADLSLLVMTFANGDPTYMIAGLGLWTAEVQVAWNDYLNGRGSLSDVWAAALEGSWDLRRKRYNSSLF